MYRSSQGERPQPRTLVDRYTTYVHNAHIDLEDGRRLFFHLLHRKRLLFKGEQRRHNQPAVCLEEYPFEEQKWHEFRVTLTRIRLPEEVRKPKHRKRVIKGEKVWIKIASFRFDSRQLYMTVSKAFRDWLAKENLPDNLFGEAEKIVRMWTEKKKK